VSAAATAPAADPGAVFVIEGTEYRSFQALEQALGAFEGDKAEVSLRIQTRVKWPAIVDLFNVLIQSGVKRVSMASPEGAAAEAGAPPKEGTILITIRARAPSVPSLPKSPAASAPSRPPAAPADE
jgi:hypothetical protein